MQSASAIFANSLKIKTKINLHRPSLKKNLHFYPIFWLNTEKMDRSLINYAMSFVGSFYSWGGNGPSYDCSGLISEILRAGGIVANNYRNSSQGMYFDFKDVWEELDTPLPGAVIFYANEAGVINHVAFAVSELSIVEAAGGGSKTLTDADAIRDQAFVRLRPYYYRKPFKIYLPKYPKLQT